MSRILITGATGFIGKRLLQKLSDRKYLVDIIVRDLMKLPGAEFYNNYFFLDDIDSVTDWKPILCKNDIIIHLSARVHIMNDKAKNPLFEFRKANVESTLNFARQAAIIGVKRFIFLSSIKVNGESTIAGQLFTEKDIPKPIDAYGISKFETEKGLFLISDELGMDVVCIRPPLVYGPGVKANFLNMIRWLYRGFPLPLGAIHNKRSLVALDNLVDLIMVCIDHPRAANQVFIAGDGEDLSTSELLRRVCIEMGKPVRLFSINQKLLESSLNMLNRSGLAQRLCGSLQVDISKAKTFLNWTPVVTVEQGLHKTVQHFIETET